MPATLAIAAGGGGDAITAAVVARRLGYVSAVMTYSWDRLLVDPLPGPRKLTDFQGLHFHAPHVFEVLPTSSVTPPGGSTLPQLAGTVPARLLLLDPSAGATGMAQQMQAAAKRVGADELAVIDVGGGAIAEGHEAGLRSPIADYLALAAACLTTCSVQLLTVGVGLDGELTPKEVHGRLDLLDATELVDLDADDFADVRHVFEWHPSESNGLVAAAAEGVRGTVETRDHGGSVQLTDTSTTVYAVDGRRALEASSAARLSETTTLDGVEDHVREFRGTSEIDYERTKAARRPSTPAQTPTVGSLDEVDRHAKSAADRGVDYLSVRRIAELIGATDRPTMQELRRLLGSERGAQYSPPLFRTT